MTKTGKYILAALFIFALTGCPNDMMRDLVEEKVSSPVSNSIEINDGLPGTPVRTVIVSPDVTKNNDLLEMRLRNESGGWSSWTPYSKNTEWTLSDGDGVKTVYVEVRDQGRRSVILLDTIILDTTVPEGGFKVKGTAISGNADDYINSPSAVLFMNVSDSVDMRFNNEGGPWSDWINYTPSTMWTLSAGDGNKTVNAEFRNIAMVVTPRSDNIILDTVAPSVSAFQINSGDAVTNNGNVTLGYDYIETNTVWAQYLNDGGSWSALEALAGSPVSRAWGLRSENGTRTVSVRLRDIAGNISTVIADTIYLNTEAPDFPVPYAVTPTNNQRPVWNWDAVADAVEYRIQLNSNGGSWTNIGDSLTWTPSADLENGSHTLYVQAADAAGNWSGSGSHTLLIDIVQPIVSGIAASSSNANDFSWAKTGDTITVTFNASDSSSGISGLPSVTIAGNAASVSHGGAGSYNADYVMQPADSEGDIGISINVYDHAGNLTSGGGSTGIIYDKTAPVITGFTLNKGNTYSASPVVRASYAVTDNYTTDIYDLEMRLQGASDTGFIPYEDYYDFTLNPDGLGNAAGTVTFMDRAGNTAALSDTIIVKTAAADIRYENQTKPSYFGEAAFDLGSFSDWDIYGGDSASGDLQPNADPDVPMVLSGNAALWDEDWYVFYMDTGYLPQFTISSDSVLDGFVVIEAFSDSGGNDVLDFTTSVSGDGRSITIQVDWNWTPSQNIWIKIHRPDGNYSGTSYNLAWNISIL